MSTRTMLLGLGVAGMIHVPVGSAWADIIPEPGFEVETFSTLDHALEFQVMMGRFAPDGNLLVASRAAVGPSADHNILSVDATGSDTVVSTPAQYPPPDRFCTHMLTHQSNDDLMFVLDAGRIVPCVPEDGRMFTLEISTGNIGVTIGTGNGLIDPSAMARDPITGDIFIADRGCWDIVGDGAVHRWNGSGVSVVLGGIDASGLCFLDDGTYYLNGVVGETEGIFHMSGSTVLQTVAQDLGLPAHIAVHDGAVGMPAGLYTGGGSVLPSQAIYWLPDANGDFVADDVILIATGTQGVGKFVFDGFGRLLTIDEATHHIVAIRRTPGDCDTDGDRDLADFACFQRCFTGPGPVTLDPGCDLFDAEPDADVDLDDLNSLLAVFSGP